MSPTIYRLQCNTQSYDWGKLGNVSKVAHYANKSGATTDPTKPYAELWMGTHPNAPSILAGTDTTLKSIIEANPDLSSSAIYEQYNKDLPFLFKILSIRKALSIQAHPDKILGARLFKEFPSIYKDPNHKPEMAIAITPFEALCGFRPLNEIADHIQRYPEFEGLIGSDVSARFVSTVQNTDAAESENKAVLKAVFEALMNSPQEKVTEQLNALIERLKDTKAEDTISNLLLRLDQEYPGGDVGVFAVLMLNYVTMEPGQAIFLGANEPHAYLSGDCVECMATSDNVVRAGLTPKFKDVRVLVNMLTYRYGSAESQKMTPVPFGDHSLLYDPPIEEFSVVLARLKASESESQKPLAGPSILIVTSGSGELQGENSFPLDEGYVYFIGANTPITTVAGDSGLEFYRAFALPSQ
ncbi:Mannose-6-phosphate isomerase [Apophysomyces ossiformis]|uniref:Mannose-6-phosphate isomerase n=1 Tax=Apophysomyces ossiformis TaxID=679940 RepID=A0A8H7BD79_9FUNG|nr:Mannose-6-phosphate isomerase [Apophysomyces ossiformis]